MRQVPQPRFRQMYADEADVARRAQQGHLDAFTALMRHYQDLRFLHDAFC